MGSNSVFCLFTYLTTPTECGSQNWPINLQRQVKAKFYQNLSWRDLSFNYKMKIWKYCMIRYTWLWLFFKFSYNRDGQLKRMRVKSTLREKEQEEYSKLIKADWMKYSKETLSKQTEWSIVRKAGNSTKKTLQNRRTSCEWRRVTPMIRIVCFICEVIKWNESDDGNKDI